MKQVYKIKITPQALKEYGFKYNILNQCYTYEFPTYKYKRKPLILCKVTIYEDDNTINFTVIEISGSLYAPYYNREFGKNDILDIIDKNIDKQFKKFGIEKKVGDKL